jgi:hypothetical protein
LPVLVLLAACAGTIAGCGKKGPPLAPLRPAPGRVEDLKIRRLGDEVHVQFTVPTKNADGRGPADIERVTVYALTGEAVNRQRQPLAAKDFDKYAAKVASFEVQPPPDPVEDEAEGEETVEPLPPPPPPPGPPDARPAQGQVLSVVEKLTPALLSRFVPPGKVPVVREVPPTPPIVVSPFPRTEPPPARVYVAIARSRKDQFGPLSARLSVPLTEVPPTPPAPEATYTASAITVTWVPPAGARVPIQLPSPAVAAAPPTTVAAPAPSPVAEMPAPPRAPTPVTPATGIEPRAAAVSPTTAPTETMAPEGMAQAAALAPLASRLRLPFPIPVPHTYNLYEHSAVGPAPGSVPRPLNAQPLATTTYTDARLTFGVERCYVVRTVEAAGQVTVESAPSPPVCVTPRDTFAPAAPRGLAAVGGEGAINLIWEPVGEADLGGYLVLRAEVGGGELVALTPEPVKETTYRDAAVQAGVRYVYAVVAVDTASPRNVSAESNRVEETAR